MALRVESGELPMTDAKKSTLSPTLPQGGGSERGKRLRDIEAFYERIEPGNMAPLRTRLHARVPDQPTPIGVPCQWRYAEARPFVLESADHISAREAERRVLILEN